MEWRDALAQTFLAEVQSFGEDVLFRGKTISASVGQSEANKSLELSGYYEEQSLNLVVPLTEYSGLDSDPKVNETILIRKQGFRIDSVEKREDAIELNVEKIAGFQYIDPTPVPIGDKQQPLSPTNIFVAIGRRANAPRYITINRSPLEPSNILLDRSPLSPTRFRAISNPLAPSNIFVSASAEPLAPSNITADRSPLEPSNISLEINPLAPSNITIDRSPINASNLTIDKSPAEPSNISLETIPLEPSSISIDRAPIAPGSIVIDRSPIAPSSITTRALFDPSQASPEGWWDPSDASTLTISSGEVTQATDKSSNGYTLAPLKAGATGPSIGNRTLNGLNVFEFTGASNNVLENNSFSWNQATNQIRMAMVYRLDDDGTTDQDFLMSGTESTTRISVRRLTDNRWQILCTGGNITTADALGEEPVTQMMVAKFNGSSSSIRIDGDTKASGAIGNVAFSSLNISGNYYEDQGIEGFIAEIIFFTDSEKTLEVEGYLAHKWGLTSNLPASHPYKTSVP